MNTVKNEYKYKMSKTMAKDLLANRKGDELKIHPQKYLCNVVNNEFGLKGICVEVVYY